MASEGLKSWLCNVGKLLCLLSFISLFSKIGMRTSCVPGCCLLHCGETKRRCGGVGQKVAVGGQVRRREVANNISYV